MERENNGFEARWCGNRVTQGGSRPHVIFARSEVGQTDSLHLVIDKLIIQMGKVDRLCNLELNPLLPCFGHLGLYLLTPDPVTLPAGSA